MTITANMHDVKLFAAGQYGGSAWLSIKDDKSNSYTVFMPYAQAKAVAEAFSEYEVEK